MSSVFRTVWIYFGTFTPSLEGLNFGHLPNYPMADGFFGRDLTVQMVPNQFGILHIAILSHYYVFQKGILIPTHIFPDLMVTRAHLPSQTDPKVLTPLV